MNNVKDDLKGSSKAVLFDVNQYAPAGLFARIKELMNLPSSSHR